MRKRFVTRWRRFWLSQGGYGSWGRMATRLGTLGAKRHRALVALAMLHPRGYISTTAEIIDVDLRLGANVLIGERTVVACWEGKGFVDLGDRVQVLRETLIELLADGSVTIGADSAIQPRCLFHSAVQPITIGRRALIASYCVFFSFDHGMAPDSTIFYQPLVSKGPIVLEDDVWLGAGVKVLANVTIGAGAVVAAGSVVTKSIPSGAIAAGVPARVLKYRKD